jgi:PPOX class probable F420-dependent enzyme
VPELTPSETRERFAAARVARLATLGPAGPALVPVCFAVEAPDTIWMAVDHKPKRTTALARLRNVQADPRVSLIADHYDDEDWSRLWWARAAGTAEVLEGSAHAVDLLRERYSQYREHPPAGPVLEITVRRWSGWAAG